MAKQRCYICLGEGRVHLPRCGVNTDPEVTCNCGRRPCPACDGTGSTGVRKARDYVQLIDRAHRLLTFQLGDEELKYVQSLIRRLGSGSQPILTDWFRSQELIRKYVNKKQSGTVMRRTSVVEQNVVKKKKKR